jgi:magnesium chelatase family protein
MEIFGADLRGIDGELIRLRVLGERDSNGVHILGNARHVTVAGTVERCLNAIHTMEGFENVGSNLRYTIDLSPVEAKVQSPGIDLPLAITLLRATVAQSLDDLHASVETRKANLATVEESHASARGTERRRELRKRFLAELQSLHGQLAVAEQYQHLLAGNATSYLLIGKLDITTGAIESPRDGMLGLIAAARPGMTIIVPEGAEVHAAIVASGLDHVLAFKARDITEVWAVITGQAKGRHCSASNTRIRQKTTAAGNAPDLKDIIGNGRAKLAMEAALAGRHSLLFVGPAGHGKSMLAQAATQLLPALDRRELLEVNKIYSARGELAANELVLTRPYQEASNSITEAALFGGGANIRPGLISAAHRGILFFDEVNITPEAVLEKLRAPWSNGVVEIQRANETARMPARFQFIGAMNPCKCSMHFHHTCTTCRKMLVLEQTCPEHPRSKRTSACSCSRRDVARYLGRLSQPIRDRIDIVCLVSRYDQDGSWHDSHATRTVRTRIRVAWERQRVRYAKFPRITCNGDVPHINKMLETGGLVPETVQKLDQSLAKRGVVVGSLRKRTQLLALCRTVADLEDSSRVTADHVEKTVLISGLAQGMLDRAITGGRP